MDKIYKAITFASLSALAVGSALIVLNRYIQTRDIKQILPEQLTGGALYAQKVDEAKAAISRQQLERFADAATVFCLKVGRLPHSLSEFVEGDPSPLAELRDAWGHQYTFELTGNSVLLRSLGKDGQVGGAGPNQDISIELAGSVCGRAPVNGVESSSPKAGLSDVKDALGVK